MKLPSLEMVTRVASSLPWSNLVTTLVGSVLEKTMRGSQTLLTSSAVRAFKTDFFSVLIHCSSFSPAQADLKLQANGLITFINLFNVYQGDRDVDLCWDYSTISSSYDWRDVLVIVVVQYDQLAILLVRLVSAVRHLVAPLLHLDTLPVVAGELVLSTACQLQ